MRTGIMRTGIMRPGIQAASSFYPSHSDQKPFPLNNSRKGFGDNYRLSNPACRSNETTSRQRRPEPAVASCASTPASDYRRYDELPSCLKACRAFVYPASPHQWTNYPESNCHPPIPSPNNQRPHGFPLHIAS